MPAKHIDAHHRVVSRLLTPVLLVAAVLVVFGSVAGHGFLSWDDEDFLVSNAGFRGLAPANLKYILTDVKTFGYYAPVTWLSFALDHVVSGVSARGVHIHNLLLHAVNALLVYLLAVRLLARALPGRDVRVWGGAAALLFALHPLRVEPVAWATARGYLLAGLFAFASLYACVRYADARIAGHPAIGWWIGCCACYALSLLAVPVAIGLPLVMLVLDAYPLGRSMAAEKQATPAEARSVWLEKSPLFLLAIVAVVATPLAKATQGSLTQEYSPLSGVAVAAYSLAFGVAKSILPIRLSPLYQLYPGFSPVAPSFATAMVFVVALTVLLVRLRRRFPAGLAAWACYVILMLPVSGLVHYGLQLTADRYTYVAGAALAILAGGLLAGWAQAARSPGRVPLVMTGLVVLILAGTSWRYTQVWRDSERLWQQVVDLDERSYTGLNNLAIVRSEQGRHAEALALFQRAATANPAYPPLRNNLGHIAAAQGRLEEAAAHYEAYLAAKPDPQTRIMLATVLARAGRIPEAVEQAQLVNEGEQSESTLYALLTGKLIDQGHDVTAVQVTRAGLALMPEDPVLLNNLAWLLAASHDPECRNGAEALDAAERMMVAMRGRPQTPPQFFAVLAAAYAEQGRFEEAVKHVETAMAIARKLNDSRRVDDYATQRNEYRTGKPHREPPPAPSPWALLSSAKISSGPA